MDDYKLPKQTMEWTPQSRRKRSDPGGAGEVVGRYINMRKKRKRFTRRSLEK